MNKGIRVSIEQTAEWFIVRGGMRRGFRCYRKFEDAARDMASHFHARVEEEIELEEELISVK